MAVFMSFILDLLSLAVIFEMHFPLMFSNHTDYSKVNTKNIISFNVHVINLSKMDIEAIA